MLYVQLIQGDPDIRSGFTDKVESANEIKSHSFFSLLPMDSTEEGQYVVEEEERQRHEQARNTRYIPSSVTGNIVRKLSHSAGTN